MIHESHMNAMVLERPGERLKALKLPIPLPGSGEILLKVQACGICRTDLHIVDGELSEPNLPLIPGHQIIGVVESLGIGVGAFIPVILSGSHGWGELAESATSVFRDARISAIWHFLPAISVTAVSPNTVPPTRISVSASLMITRRHRQLRYSVPV
jgi:hypothetical protein